MLEVQKIFNNSTTLVNFVSEMALIGVNVRDYPEHEMMLLDYDQIEAIKNHPAVNECRGLIMGYDGQIIRKGFTRFYNLGENGVDQFDFGNSLAFEKADGSLMFVYYCNPTRRWEIGTRGTAFAEGSNERFGTFRGFMLNAMGRTEDQFQSDCDELLSRCHTFLFEAVGPDNRIVTPYETNHLIELCSVEVPEGYEVVCVDKSSIFKTELNWNVRPIKHYRFDTKEHCMEALEALKGLEEGFVVYNRLTGMRVKIKSAVYLAAHRLRGNGLSLNSICELVAMNEQDEYIASFPEDASKFYDAICMLHQMEVELIGNYEAHRMIETQKDFAIAIMKLPLSGVMFAARKTQCDVLHTFNQTPTNKKAEWLKDRLTTPNERLFEAMCSSTDC